MFVERLRGGRGLGRRDGAGIAPRAARARRDLRVGAACVAAASFALWGAAAGGAEWARFRGPNGSGVAADANVPATWTVDDCAWTAELPGRGHSSPVGWGDLLWATSADPQDGTQYLSALDTASGAMRWSVRRPGKPYRVHDANSLASSSPAADAQHVYALWAAPEGVTLAAYGHDGVEAWQCELGPFVEPHGYGCSPVPLGDVVIVAHQHEGSSHVSAIDAADGGVRWRTERPSGTSSFATPVAWPSADAPTHVIVASTAGGLAALRLADGGAAWQVGDAFPVRCVGSPLLAEGLLIASCGEGGSGKRLVAVRPPTSADAAPELAYELRKSVPQSPTPVALGELLFVWHDRGIVTCCDAATGAVKWQERVGGRYYGSPIVVGDKLIAVTETGEVVTLAARAEFAELGRVRLEETCHATPAVLRGMLVVRTEARLRAVSGMR